MEELGHLVEIPITGPTESETQGGPSELKGLKRRWKWVKTQAQLQQTKLKTLEKTNAEGRKRNDPKPHS